MSAQTLRLRGLVLPDVVEQEVQGDPGVDDVVEEQDVAALVGDGRGVEDLGARRGCRPPPRLRARPHHVHGQLEGDLADQVGQEDEAARHEPDHRDLLVPVELRRSRLPARRADGRSAPRVNMTSGFAFIIAPPPPYSRTGRAAGRSSGLPPGPRALAPGNHRTRGPRREQGQAAALLGRDPPLHEEALQAHLASVPVDPVSRAPRPQLERRVPRAPPRGSGSPSTGSGLRPASTASPPGSSTRPGTRRG